MRVLEGSERDELLATLGWWVEAGVDTLVDAGPRDWRTPPPRAATREIPASVPEPELVLPTGAASPPATVMATTIAELRHAVEIFEGCPLRTGNVSTVFADGNPEADLMLMDEPATGLDTPSQEELFTVLDSLRGEKVTVMFALHDLKLAASNFDRVMLLNHRLVGIGKPETVFTKEHLNAAYGDRIQVLEADHEIAMVDDTCCGEEE